MKTTLIIAQRELLSFFYSPIGYVTLTIFTLLSGIFFSTIIFVPGQQASMQLMFGFWLPLIVAIITPPISMRLFAEELKSGTIEPLMTSPITEINVVIGKWLGSLAFFLIAISPTLIFVLLLEIFGDPDYGPLLTGYLGLTFTGALYLSIGTFTSTLTRSQIIAFLSTLLVILTATVGLQFLVQYLPVDLGKVVLYMNPTQHNTDLAKGLINLKDVAYFVTVTLFFLLLAVKSVESRKWR